MAYLCVQYMLSLSKEDTNHLPTDFLKILKL